MATDVGNQTVSIIFGATAASSIVNKRHKDVRQLGIYQGGRLSIVDGTHASLSPLVCEISDGTHQVRVEMTTLVTGLLVAADEYIVLRWLYTGVAIADFMEVLAVATPASNDLVVGKCNFGAGVLIGFDYGDTSYPRSTPNTQDLFLKVEPTEDTELKVRVRAGRVQNPEETFTVIDQKSTLFVLPGSNSKVYLLYVDTSDGTIKIDSSGTAAASPVAPDYVGKLVLAEVTLTSTDTNITANKIKDVRSFITVPVEPDGITLEIGTDGKLKATTSLFSPFAYTGGESVTYPNGLIKKMGYIARTGQNTIVTFSIAFPNGIKTVDWKAYKVAGIAEENQCISSINKTAFTIKDNSAWSGTSVTGYYWTAEGW